MPELKRNFLKGRMNKRVDERLVPNGEYRDATNIQISTSQTEDAGAIESLLGNSKQDNRVSDGSSNWDTNLGLTSPSIIGSYVDTLNNKIYYYVTGQYDSGPVNAVLEYDSATTVLDLIICDSRPSGQQVLNFNTNNLITGINIIDGLLFWTDNLNEPRCINIETFRAGSGTGSDTNIRTTTTKLFSKKQNANVDFVAEDINVIKKGPTKAPEVELRSSALNRGVDVLGVGMFPLNTQRKKFTDSNGEVDYSATADNLKFTEPIQSITEFLRNKIKLEAEVKNSLGVLEKFTVIGSISNISQNKKKCTFTPEVIPANIPNKAIAFKATVIEGDYIYRRSFPRFSYRWKYNDNQYSQFAPFTEPCFLAPSYKYEATAGENESMLNHIREITLTFPERETTFGPPRDVKAIEVLYKPSGSENVHVVKTVQLDNVDPNLTAGEFVRFTFTEELDGPIVESNQSLRLFDAVPKVAQAQEAIGNRIVYGNYKQGYDEPSHVPIRLTRGSRENEPIFGFPELSAKSGRSYQMGITFLDEFLRESPVITNSSASVLIDSNFSKRRNTLIASVDNDGVFQVPTWASFFKYYIKENYSRQYNLSLDRFYDSEDGNYWLSFASVNRNKVTEDDVLVLKKRHGNNGIVEIDNEYKILDIKNEAPEYLRINNLKTIARATVAAQDSNIPIVDLGASTAQKTVVTFMGPSRVKNERFSREINNARAIQFVKAFSPGGGAPDYEQESKIYRIKSAGTLGTGSTLTTDTAVQTYKITLAEEVSSQDQFVDDVDQTNEELDIILYGSDEFLPQEYQGRFFVKIQKLGSFHNDIIVPSSNEDSRFFVKNAHPLNAVGEIMVLDPSNTDPLRFFDQQKDVLPLFLRRASSFGSTHELRRITSFKTRLFNKNEIKDVTRVDTVHARLFFGFIGDGTGLTGVTSGFTTVEPNTSGNTFTLVHGPLEADVDETGNVFDNIEAGAIIAFTHAENGNDGSAYTVTKVSNVATLTGDNSDALTYNSMTVHLDRNPGVTFPDIPLAKIGNIKILGVNTSLPLVNNPAIFETKAEKNINLDIYYESSDAFPVSEIHESKPLRYFNCVSFGNGVESFSIGDLFNSPFIDQGVRVSSILKETFKEEHKASTLIFSGIINTGAKINETNQFLLADNITKDLNPIYGSIQKLSARGGGARGDLLVLCEDKCLRVLANRDALFNADGNAQLTASNRVLGAAEAYAGEYGISKNPESFASYGFRSYFADKSRRAVIRLSGDGITVLSDKNMANFFDAWDTYTGNIYGSYDQDTGTYNVTTGAAEQVSFDEGVDGWTSRLTYGTDFSGVSLDNFYYTFKNGFLWKHDNSTRANFYNSQKTTTVTVIFNDAPSSIKNFKTIFYEGDSGWTVDLETDKQTGVINVGINPDLKTSTSDNFFEREGKYYNFISNDALTWTNSSQSGNLDTAEFAVQGIGNTSGYSDGSNATVSFAASLTFPNSMQADKDNTGTGDQFFYVRGSNIYKLGEITGIDQSAGTITVTKQLSDVPAALPQVGGGDFAFFVKDPQANTSGILGYFNKATFTNTGTGKNELFTVGTEAFISSR